MTSDRKLNELMEFDSPIVVTEDGRVIDAPRDIYAPNMYSGELEPGTTGWELMNGYSGQDRYSGPSMHPSEYIGGQMERDILDNPGVYVVIVDYWPPDEEDEEREDGAMTAEGWAVARRI